MTFGVDVIGLKYLKGGLGNEKGSEKRSLHFEVLLLDKKTAGCLQESCAVSKKTKVHGFLPTTARERHELLSGPRHWDPPLTLWLSALSDPKSDYGGFPELRALWPPGFCW